MIRFRFSRLFAWTLLTTLSICTATASFAKNIGTIVELKAGAFGTPPGGSLSPKHMDDGVVQDEFIETVRHGALRIDLIDETTLSLGSESKLVLDELVFDPESLSGSSQIRFAKGVFFWVTGQIATKGDMILDTPVATIGIRGTEFSLKIGPDGATQVAVVDGLVDLRSKATGEIISIPAGHNADVNAVGRVSPLRVGVPPTGDASVDALVAKAEAKVQQVKNDPSGGGSAADVPGLGDERRSLGNEKDKPGAAGKGAGAEPPGAGGNLGRLLPVKAKIMKLEASNDGGRPRTSYRLDRSFPITTVSNEAANREWKGRGQPPSALGKKETVDPGPAASGNDHGKDKGVPGGSAAGAALGAQAPHNKDHGPPMHAAVANFPEMAAPPTHGNSSPGANGGMGLSAPAYSMNPAVPNAPGIPAGQGAGFASPTAAGAGAGPPHGGVAAPSAMIASVMSPPAAAVPSGIGGLAGAGPSLGGVGPGNAPSANPGPKPALVAPPVAMSVPSHAAAGGNASAVKGPPANGKSAK